MKKSTESAKNEPRSSIDKSESDVALVDAVDALREALLKLRPEREDGFEGLLATVFTELCGLEFRLAKSGQQDGKDGETLITTSNHISFEAKLYSSKLKDTDVLNKITNIIGSHSPPDLWILGATEGASTQLLSTMQNALKKIGIGLLVLDWPKASEIPPLAIVCAMAKEKTCAFLREHITDTDCVRKAELACSRIQTSERFEEESKKILGQLKESSLALANAQYANRIWHERAFSSRSIAKAKFGQNITPNAEGPLAVQKRSSLTEQLHQYLSVEHTPRVVAIVGGEGHGKSWLAAQSWLELTEPPILLMVSAADFNSATTNGSFERYLLLKFIEQTGDTETEITRNRWERRFKQWKEMDRPLSPRFIFCIDGLNQQPDFNWARWLEGAATDIKDLGGTLVITSRETYFNDRIRANIYADIFTVRVPEWSEQELKKILSTKGIYEKNINRNVFARLRNPRILSIALDLVSKGTVIDFDELSVDRLLFEHIRVGSCEGNTSELPDQFSKRLAEHAKTILNRVSENQLSDRYTFLSDERIDGHSLSSDLLAVTAEHFFKPLPEDPTLYKLAEDGLTIALGLAILKALQVAERDGRSVGDALDELIEPIAALDRTAEAIFSAVMLSSLDERYSPTIRQALICNFLCLQNIDFDSYPAFVSVVRNITGSAIDALFECSNANKYVANKDWLISSLRDCRDKPKCWEVISERASEWLCFYTLEPKISTYHYGGRNAEKFAKEVEDKSRALEKKVSELSPSEQSFLSSKMHNNAMVESFEYLNDAFALLAGMPLSNFAEQLVACSFSLALNSSISAPYEQLLNLIRFNTRDWKETRNKLLIASNFLTQSETSKTGKWALVTLLRSVSTLIDAEREEELVISLTKDREKFSNWRLVENYCASDPCNPLSKKPENIDKTAEKFYQIDVAEVSRHLGMTEVDHFIRDALPGMVRFRPDVAIDIQRKISSSIVERKTKELWLGIASLESHCASIENDTVTKLLEIARAYSSVHASDLESSRDDWAISQYALLLAYPHLSGEEQLQVQIDMPPQGPTLLKRAEVVKTATPELLESAMEHALQTGDSNRISEFLMFTQNSRTCLTEKVKLLIGPLIEHEDTYVRAGSMGVIAVWEDNKLIGQIAASKWNANLLDSRTNHSEIWYGSQIILLAAKLNMISINEALDRITPTSYSMAVEILKEACYDLIGRRLIVAASKVLDIDIALNIPSVKQNIEENNQDRPPLYSLDIEENSSDPKEFFEQLSEKADEFDSRQKKGWEAFHSFEAILTKKDARIIIENVGFKALEAGVSTIGIEYEIFAEKLLTIEELKLSHIRNFALLLARALSIRNQELSGRLLSRFMDKRAVLHLVSGLSEIPLESICIWNSDSGTSIDKLRNYRLNRAANDHELAQEVLAAIHAGQFNFLEKYIEDNLGMAEPVANARALMVIGFGLKSDENFEILNKYKNARGLVGKSYKAALFAYERNIWAMNWYREMSSTNSAKEFWSLSILFLKIVDGRFDAWRGEVSITGTASDNFMPSIMEKTKSRVKAWKTKRVKTLFGDKAPLELFLKDIE